MHQDLVGQESGREKILSIFSLFWLNLNHQELDLTLVRKSILQEINEANPHKKLGLSNNSNTTLLYIFIWREGVSDWSTTFFHQVGYTTLQYNAIKRERKIHPQTRDRLGNVPSKVNKRTNFALRTKRTRFLLSYFFVARSLHLNPKEIYISFLNNNSNFTAPTSFFFFTLFRMDVFVFVCITDRGTWLQRRTIFYMYVFIKKHRDQTEKLRLHFTLCLVSLWLIFYIFPTIVTLSGRQIFKNIREKSPWPPLPTR